jgi:hypothetical protein
MRKYCLLVAMICVCNWVVAEATTTATVQFKIKNAVSGTVTISLAVNNTGTIEKNCQFKKMELFH